MNDDALDRRPENDRIDRPDRPDGSGRSGQLDQVVFRWDGNQGRSSTGMAAVAHSCSAERAEALRRELGPLLWVPGPGPDPRPSSVRVPSRTGGTVLLQRWPTLDRGGRPSTACHAVFGDPDTLTPLHCLGLNGSAWSDRAVAKTVSGALPPLDGAELRATATERLRAMTRELPTVKKPLVVVTAEWLRDPSRRLSLLAEEHELPGWPRRNAAPLLYLGLLSVFGDWFGTEWSYTTYDTVDTHPLRLTCVPRWTSQAAGARSLARIRLRLPAEKDVEMAAAKEMVEYVLDRPDAPPGVPHLTGELLSGARMSGPERRDALRRMLTTRHAPARTPAPAYEDRYEDKYEDRYEDRYEREDRADPRDIDHHHGHRQERPYPEHHQQEQHQQDRRQQEQHQQERHQQDRHQQELLLLHDELLSHQGPDTARSARLAARLQDLRDTQLLPLLRSERLPWASRELVLAELGHPDRLRTRDPETEHALCSEVLRHNLYFRPSRPEPGSPPTAEMRERAADLFSWAVAPLVRDPHQAPDLRPLFNIFLKDGRGNGMEWLRRVLVAPPGGRAPDLPPELWQQIVTDLLAHPAPAPAPKPVTAPAPAPAQPAAVPAPAKPPVPLPPSYAAASAAAPTPPPPAVPVAPAPPTSARTAPGGHAARSSSGLSDLLYKTWFVPTFAGVVGVGILGILLMIALN
ncbi:hypothetical protein NEH83_17430 [Streptomyces sp. JUS-F4]|uniref:hypothetical protein n=1 Tax=Streptomyces sp. JUS-F4 TaxID=2951988 RepID=UPI00266514A1|nr:hypothetical protein [Streptomyces sp. JUS-F4]WKN15807.1 hypothetical protein NEH83_17430 [Streptomyces sp. JUS-F4]